MRRDTLSFTHNVARVCEQLQPGQHTCTVLGPPRYDVTPSISGYSIEYSQLPLVCCHPCCWGNRPDSLTSGRLASSSIVVSVGSKPIRSVCDTIDVDRCKQAEPCTYHTPPLDTRDGWSVDWPIPSIFPSKLIPTGVRSREPTNPNPGSVIARAKAARPNHHP